MRANRVRYRGGGVEKKFLVPAYSFFFGGYPRRGGGVRKKNSRKFFPPPPPGQVFEHYPGDGLPLKPL